MKKIAKLTLYTGITKIFDLTIGFEKKCSKPFFNPNDCSFNSNQKIDIQ